MKIEDIEICGETTKVFLSYSRKDRIEAQRIASVLGDRDIDVFKDTEDILPTEEWKDRLEQLISEADTVVFLLSPDSAISKVCAWEIDFATSLNKRIAPIVIKEVDTANIPPLLARLNFIFCTARDRFEDAVDNLVLALNSDIEWIREHTRLNSLAYRWNSSNRVGNLLLRGQSIVDSETWRDKRPREAPALTSLQTEYISTSRRAAVSRQRYWIFGTAGIAVALGGLAVFSFIQMDLAEKQSYKANLRREEVLRSYAGQRLRNGERVGAVTLLNEITTGKSEPQKSQVVKNLTPQMKVLLAGLKNAKESTFDAEPGTPVFLNGKIYLLQEAKKTPVEVTGFPAKWYSFLGDQVLLTSASGAMRILERKSGKEVDSFAPKNELKPCFNWRLNNQSITVVSTYWYGYSACGGRLSITPVTGSGFGESVERGLCSGQDEMRFGKSSKSYLSTQEVVEICIAKEDFTTSFAKLNKNYRGPGKMRMLKRIPDLQFPGKMVESNIWKPMQPVGIVQAGISARKALSNWDAKIPKENLDQFALSVMENSELSSYLLPNFVETPHLKVAESIHTWGGTGGSAYFACLSLPQDKVSECLEIVVTGGNVNGMRLAPNAGVMAVFGRDIQSPQQKGWEATTNFSLIIKDKKIEVRTLSELNQFGAVFDADFHSSKSKIAILTGSSLILFDYSMPGGKIDKIITPPLNAVAVQWISDNSLIVLSSDGSLYFTQPGQTDFSRIGLRNLVDRQADEKMETGQFWLNESENGKFISVGHKNKMQLFDIGMRAPLTDVVSLPDPQLKGRNIIVNPKIKIGPMGSVEVQYNKRSYLRRPIDPNTNIVEYTDVKAILGGKN